MKNKLFAGLAAALLTTLNPHLSAAFAQGTALTYQGRLNDGANPAAGIYDLRFTIYDSPVTGSIVAGPVTNSTAAITNGLFTVTLDFGAGVFDGSERWLEIAVRTNGAGAFVPLSARQEFTAAPYAITAGNLGGALRVELNTNGAPNLAGGSPVNQVDAGNIGSVIGGGGAANYFGFAYSNHISADFAVIAGGIGNLAQGFGSFIGGGYGNSIDFSAFYGGIVGGDLNSLNSNAGYSFIGGGHANSNSAPYAVIGGGQNNTIAAGAGQSVIGGGWLNYIEPGADQSVVAGGNAGRIQAGARESFIGGGFANTIQTNSINAFIGSGAGNTIGTNAFYSTIAGGQNNLIEAGAQQATIGGGAFNRVSYRSTIGGGQGNSISNAFIGTIGGGLGNSIGSSVQYGVIGGGYRNQLSPFAHAGAIGGGLSNAILFGVDFAAVGGGSQNVIGGDYSTIAGGARNQIGRTYSAIGGGIDNVNNGQTSVIAGGEGNSADFFANHSTIGGGFANAVQSNAQYAAIPGGVSNAAAGASSFAAGNRAKALHNGAFVWADSQAADFSSTATNQFLIRASGGVGIGTTNPGAALDVIGSVRASSFTIGSSAVVSNFNSDLLDGFDAAAFWKLSGNTGTVPGTHFLGTTDNQPLELRANNQSVARFFYASNGNFGISPNLVGGFKGNLASAGVVGAVIAGGGATGYGTNLALADQAVVSGGFGNISSASAALVAGGAFNVSGGPGSSVSGGHGNFANGYTAVVGGGSNNTNNGNFATIGGGNFNVADGFYTTVPGGFSNSAVANYSFAAGRRAKANHPGSFVWADSQDADFASTVNNEFTIRAAGGVRLVTGGAGLTLDGQPVLGASSVAPASGSANYIQNQTGVAQGASFNINGTMTAASFAVANGTVTGSVSARDLIVTNSLKAPGAGIGTSTPAFVHRATAANIEAGSPHRTTITHPLCDGDPNAILIITHNYNPGMTGNVLDPNPTSVFYNFGFGKWQIYHDNFAAITTDCAWNVLVIKP
jgi:hypothetical protein